MRTSNNQILHAGAQAANAFLAPAKLQKEVMNWERRPWPDDHRGGGSWLACNETSTAALRAMRTLVQGKYGHTAALILNMAEEIANEWILFPLARLLGRHGIHQMELALVSVYNRAGQIAGRELRRSGIRVQSSGHKILLPGQKESREENVRIV